MRKSICKFIEVIGMNVNPYVQITAINTAKVFFHRVLMVQSMKKQDARVGSTAPCTCCQDLFPCATLHVCIQLCEIVKSCALLASVPVFVTLFFSNEVEKNKY
jgi:hypothetical protein